MYYLNPQDSRIFSGFLTLLCLCIIFNISCLWDYRSPFIIITLKVYNMKNNKENTTNKCFVCNRSQIHPSEGRIADGSWNDDRYLSEEAIGKWFCHYSCYQKCINDTSEERNQLTKEALELTI